MGLVETWAKMSRDKVTSIDKWTDVFLIFKSIYIKMYPSKCQELLQYISIIRRFVHACSHCGGQNHSRHSCLKLLGTPTVKREDISFRRPRGFSNCPRLIVLGFKDTPTLVGHFVSSPREREKRDSRGDYREEQGRKKNRNESKVIKTFPFYPNLLQG